MTKRSGLIRDAAIGTLLVLVSFGCGWWGYGREHRNTRQTSFDFTRPYRIPRTHESIGMKPVADTAPYRVGDRIDILVRIDGKIEPLILDAVVTNKTKTNFGILVPGGGRDMLAHARENGLPVFYRRSMTIGDPITLEVFDRQPR